MNNHDDRRDKFGALLRHTLQQSQIAPPADFARDVARKLDDLPEQATLESWLVRVVMTLAAATVAVSALQWTGSAVEHVLRLLDGAPWPFLLLTAGIFSGMKLMELAQQPPVDWMERIGRQ